MSFLEIIAARRDGRVHSPADLQVLARGAADGSTPDYQLAAWLMAAVLNPLSHQETVALTLAMADSGERMDLSGLAGPLIDKHSTGGVGDKTTIVLLPLLAACGLTVVKLSGRGLGITGGTVDKMAAITGFRMDMTPDEMIRQASEIGVALSGQTPRLAPADKTLYALRDATGTVASLPLIVASILSKKIAAGAKTVVFDVKCGEGAFMPDLGRARELANGLREVGAACGLRVATAITAMDRPLGRTIGNALEVREALAVLGGGGPEDTRDLCVRLAGLALAATGSASSVADGEAIARQSLGSGAAMDKARKWIAAQGGDLDAPLPAAPLQRTIVHAGPRGQVTGISAGRFGAAVVELGGGRKTKEDTIDLSVGIELHVSLGETIEPGAPLMTLHARSEADADRAETPLRTAVAFDGPPPGPLILETQEAPY